jgi:hypothetical protein
VKQAHIVNENEEPTLHSIVAYQRIYVFASQDSSPDIGLVVLPASTAHIDCIHVDHFLSFFARWRHSAFVSVVIGRDVHEGAAIKPLTRMKPSGSSVACTKGTQKRI